jgi:hypothetical protein
MLIAIVILAMILVGVMMLIEYSGVWEQSE